MEYLKKVYSGREKVRYPKPEQETLQSIYDAFNYIIAIAEKNAKETKYLYDYYRNKTPIQGKVKKVRPEINHMVNENHALEIVSFFVGFEYGKPVQYVQKSLEGATGEVRASEVVSALHELMVRDNIDSNNRRLAEWAMICGTGYKLVLPRKPFKTKVLDPRNAFVCYDTDVFEEPWLCGYKTSFNHMDEWTLFTENAEYRVVYSGGVNAESIVLVDRNPLKMLPIIEYPLSMTRMGRFEIVLDLLDAKNQIKSNRIDDVDQKVQSFMKFVNVDIDKESFTEMKELGAIKIYSRNGANADVDIVDSKFDQTPTQTLEEDIYQTILQIAGVPDRKQSTGGNTGQALILGQGWTSALARADSDEIEFIKSERKYLEVIKRILDMTKENVDVSLRNLNIAEVDIKFDINRTDNILTKTQALINLLESGVHPRIAISTVGLFSDPEEVYAQSKEILDAKTSYSEGNKVQVEGQKLLGQLNQETYEG